MKVHAPVLLALLVKHTGKVVTHRQLLLRVSMGQFRQLDPTRPWYQLTETGVSYRLHTD